MPQDDVKIIANLSNWTSRDVGRMVGAAGFEPATCCTQNSRATRLRHTPPVAAWDTSFVRSQQPSAQQPPAPATACHDNPMSAGASSRRQTALHHVPLPKIEPVT